MEGGDVSFPPPGGGPPSVAFTPTLPVDAGPGGGVDEEICGLRLVIFRLALVTLQEEVKHGFDFLRDESGGIHSVTHSLLHFPTLF